MTKILSQVRNLVWGAPAWILILGTGIYLSQITGWVQLRWFPASVRFFLKSFGRKDTSGKTTSAFDALCTALGATVGTGNLIGVAGAICLGGPGAVFWMWVCAFVGMATKYAEAALAVRFHIAAPGGFIGGPMYMIEYGMGRRFSPLAKLYSIFGIIACLGMGCAVQIRAVVSGVHSVMDCLHLQESVSFPVFLAVLLTILVGSVLLGGVRGISEASRFLVPVSGIGYILLCLYVIFSRFSRLPEAIRDIFIGAFSPRAVTGGMIGSGFSALQFGCSRGVFTNEAGLGTASIAHGTSDAVHPAQQGLLGIMEVFLDTMVICTLTALAILCSGVSIPYGSDPGVTLTNRAFASVCGDWSVGIIGLFLCGFAFATVLGWGLYGGSCVQYLFGRPAVRMFALCELPIVFFSALSAESNLWILAEITNGMMSIPNLIALLSLRRELRAFTFEFQPGSRAATGGTYANFHQR